MLLSTRLCGQRMVRRVNTNPFIWVLGLVGSLAGCFPELTPSQGSLTLGLLGVEPSVQQVRVSLSAGEGRYSQTDALNPAATTRIEVVPLGTVAVLVEAFAGEELLQSKGVNTEIISGENQLAIDLGTAGPQPPQRVLSAEHTVLVELQDGNGQERIARDPLLTFLSTAESALGGPARISHLERSTVTLIQSDQQGGLENLLGDPATLALVTEDGGSAITVGQFTPMGNTVEVPLNGMDLLPLDAALRAGRFEVRFSSTGITGEGNLRVTMIFVAVLR